ncbi:virion structural protein [Erwinia phage vB_EamM_Asesino]|uniref:Virion structural protein n=1 Tax=Erwinia phage vB_EamM_Asesino TaxID=1883370 RepID=A0A1B2IAI2_9CAUD|nr:virion structural protein [Erwinia phage vB_EamM_Asesino]ANZ48293.1 putative virion structural protein [Erwinia phage vB_EamM_Asesino]
MAKIATKLIDKDRGFEVWDPSELYEAGRPTGYVPNPRDLIINELTSGFDRVVSTNYAVPSWEVEPFGGVGVANQDGRLNGHYPLRSDKYRVYVDSSKLPATMVIDADISWDGPDIDGVRILRGSNVSDSAEILSGFYKDGKLKYTYLPTQTISVEGVETVVKKTLPGSCLAEVSNGEECMFVVYSDVGNVVQICHGRVIKTNLVMAQETPARTVLGIKLVSPFLVDDDGTTLTLPINMPLDSIPLWCDIQYSDGTKRLPIDQARVKFNGLRNSGSQDTFYISSNAGNNLPCVLSYQLAKGETYGGTDVVGDTIVKDYTAVTEQVDGAYSMKLFVVPRWLDANRGFRLDFLLYNLTRGKVYDASANIQYTSGTTFDPLLMGVKQRLNVQVDISKVDPQFRAFIQAQSFSITLVNPGNELNTNFLLEYLPDGLKYGENIWAEFKYSNVNYSELDVSVDAASKAEWLKALYEPVYPLYDRRNETGPLEPTHFEIHVGGQVYTYAVDEWMTKKVIDYRVPLDAQLVIRWLRRTPTDTLNLAATPMLAHHIE